MQIENFWELIEKSKIDADDCDEQASNLLQLLSELEPQEIVGFNEYLNEKLVEAYRWDLWAIAYIVNGGASDDGFLYFRGWLVAQGRDYFEAALANAENAAINAVAGEFNECEDILYAANSSYKDTTGKDITTGIVEPPEPAGERWEEDDLEETYPKLVRQFG